MKQRTTDGRLIRSMFYRLLPYQILLLIINAANGIVDSLHASNFIGQDAMSALGAYAPMDHFLYAVSIMLVSGSQILCGKLMGKNHRETVSGIFSVDLMLSAALGLLTALLLAAGALSGAASALLKEEKEAAALSRYMLGQSIGLPALILGQQLFSFLSLENRKRRTTAASIACMVTNAAGDALFVIVFRMGTFGLGLASSLSLWVFFSIQAHYYITGKSDLRFSFRGTRLREAWQIVRQGYAGALSRFVEMFRCVIVNILILQYVGTVGLSAFAAVNSVMAVFWPLPFGILAVCRMMLSISIGEEDRGSIAEIMRVVFSRGIVMVLVLAAGLCLLAEPVTRMFYRDPLDPVYRMTVNGFRIIPWCMVLAIVSLNYGGYAQAVEKKVAAVVIPILDGAGFVVLLSLFLIPALKLEGLFIANVLNGVLCFLTILLFSAAVRRRFPKSMEDLLAIPEGIGVPEDARLDFSVRDLSGVTEVSRRVIAFCEGRGIDRLRSAMAGLALEEMAGNVVEHGFTKDRRNHSVDIRVSHKGEDIILRLRDNCKAFNPSEVNRIMDPEDPSRNAGIRIVYGIAKDIRYQNLLGANVFSARI